MLHMSDNTYRVDPLAQRNGQLGNTTPTSKSHSNRVDALIKIDPWLLLNSMGVVSLYRISPNRYTCRCWKTEAAKADPTPITIDLLGRVWAVYHPDLKATNIVELYAEVYDIDKSKPDELDRTLTTLEQQHSITQSIKDRRTNTTDLISKDESPWIETIEIDLNQEQQCIWD